MSAPHYDFHIADNAKTPHVALMRDDEQRLVLPLTEQNVCLFEQLAEALNEAIQTGFYQR